MRYYKQKDDKDLMMYWSLLEPTQENKTDWNIVLEGVDNEYITPTEMAINGFKVIKTLKDRGLIELETTFVPINWDKREGNIVSEIVGKKVKDKIRYTPIGNIIVSESYKEVGETVCLFSSDTFYVNSNYAREIINQYLLNVASYEEGEMEFTCTETFMEYSLGVKLEEVIDSSIKHNVEFEDGEEWGVKLAPDYSCVIIDGMVITPEGKGWKDEKVFLNFKNRLNRTKGSGIYKLDITPKLEIRFNLSVGEKEYIVKLVGVFNGEEEK